MVGAPALAAGNSVTAYAVTRDQYGNFTGNGAAAWTLLNRTGGVVESDLVVAGDGQSATFTGHLQGPG